MPDSGKNIRFQVSVNHEDIGTAGIEEFGDIGLHVHWLKRSLEKVPEKKRKSPEFDPQDGTFEKLIIHLGGSDSNTDELLSWFTKELQAGDEITIRLLPGGDFDDPPRRLAKKELEEKGG